MDKKGTYLAIVFLAVIIVSIFFTYYRAIILKDFERIQSEEEDSVGLLEAETEALL